MHTCDFSKYITLISIASRFRQIIDVAISSDFFVSLATTQELSIPKVIMKNISTGYLLMDIYM